MLNARRIIIGGFVLVMVSALLAGCGGAVAQTAPPTATTAPTATPQPTVDPAAAARCNLQQQSPGDLAQVGDLLLTKPIDSLGYPNVELPAQTPLKPLQVGTQVSGNALGSGGQFAQALPVNPGASDASGRHFSLYANVCNSSTTQAHIIQGVTARIVMMTPYSGDLNVWQGCDIAFSRMHPDAHPGGCGGGVVAGEYMKAAFAPNAGVGATVTATQVSVGITAQGTPTTPLPFTLAAGASLTFVVTVVVPTAPGAYTFALGYQSDGAAVAYTPNVETLLFAPVTHLFNGAACNTSAMLQQIPTAVTPETFYVCPA